MLAFKAKLEQIQKYNDLTPCILKFLFWLTFLKFNIGKLFASPKKKKA